MYQNIYHANEYKCKERKNMNTDGKKCLRALTQAELEHINQILSGLNSELQKQFAVLADAISHEQVRYLVEDVYSLGKLREV